MLTHHVIAGPNPRCGRGSPRPLRGRKQDGGRVRKRELCIYRVHIHPRSEEELTFSFVNITNLQAIVMPSLLMLFHWCRCRFIAG